MIKFFIPFSLFISLNFFAHAQDGYIKYLKDAEYRNKTVKVFKGEIMPFIKTSKHDKINIIIGSDTITDIEKTSKFFEEAASINTYNSQKEYFLQLKKGGMVWINTTAIQNTDTVTLFSESGKQIIQLIEKREEEVKQADLGETCRLIITNSPTIFYTTDKLKQFVEPKPVQKAENIVTQIADNKGKGLFFWHLMVISVIILGSVGLGGWWILNSRNKNPIFATYNNNKSLSIFAMDNQIDLDTLIKYNKGNIDKKYKRYNDTEKKEVQKELKNKNLIVGFHKKEVVNSISSSDLTEIKNEAITKEWKNPKETTVQQTNFGGNDGLSSQLQNMENNLLREIQRVGSGNNNQNDINRLRNEKSDLEGKIRVLETDKANIESTLQSSITEKNQIQIEIKNLKEKVVEVGFLKDYSENVFSYIQFCQLVSRDAYIFFNKISQQNPKQAFAAGHLLMKFQASVNQIPVGNWMQTVQDIKDMGATTNKQLIRSFSQIQNNSDKHKEFQRLLFTEFLTKYSSNILILAEAFKNLSRFLGSAEFTNEAQSTFGKHTTEIVSKAKSTGLEIKHIPLFETWEKYIGQVEDNGGERSLAYKEIGGLEKGSIAEIVSYGVKNSLGDDTKTIIILA